MLSLCSSLTHSLFFKKPITPQLKKRNKIWKDFTSYKSLTTLPQSVFGVSSAYRKLENRFLLKLKLMICFSSTAMKVVKFAVSFPCAISPDSVSTWLNLLLNVLLLEKSLELVLIFRLFTLSSFPT